MRWNTNKMTINMALMVENARAMLRTSTSETDYDFVFVFLPISLLSVGGHFDIRENVHHFNVRYTMISERIAQ